MKVYQENKGSVNENVEIANNTVMHEKPRKLCHIGLHLWKYVIVK